MKMSFTWDYVFRKADDEPGPYETPLWDHGDIIDGIEHLKRRTKPREITVKKVFLPAAPDDKKEAREYIDIVFDAAPAKETGRFVEVESPPGTAIKVGEWIKRDDGYWVLRIKPEVFK